MLTYLTDLTPPPPPEPNVVRVLDVSTGHLTDGEREMLEDCALPGQVMTRPEGGFVYAGSWEEADNDGPPEGATETLSAIMREALARNCAYVLFDADGPGLPGFPVFEDC